MRSYSVLVWVSLSNQQLLVSRPAGIVVKKKIEATINWLNLFKFYEFICVYSVFVVIFSKLMLRVDSTDDTYMPKRVTVYGGEGENLKKYSDITIEEWVPPTSTFIYCYFTLLYCSVIKAVWKHLQQGNFLYSTSKHFSLFSFSWGRITLEGEKSIYFLKTLCLCSSVERLNIHTDFKPFHHRREFYHQSQMENLDLIFGRISNLWQNIKAARPEFSLSLKAAWGFKAAAYYGNSNNSESGSCWCNTHC